MIATILAAGDKTVDLAGGWSTFWTGIQKGNPTFSSITTLMTVIGTIVVVMAFGKWLWEKRKGTGGGGGGGRSDGILWALAAGAMLAAPNLIIPIVLTILDTVANGVAGVFDTTT